MAGKKIIKTTRFDSAAYLDSPEAIGAYLEEAAASSDAAFVTHALGMIARAQSADRHRLST